MEQSFKKIVFYNNLRNGDVFLCKGFVDEIINLMQLPTFYCHGNKKCFYKDLNLIECDYLGGGYYDNNGTITIKNNIAYINTWYNCAHGKYFSTGCTLTTLYNYFSDAVYPVLGLKINPNIEYYLPKNKFNLFDFNINLSALEYPWDKKILLCNNIPQSGQSSVNSWDNVINTLTLNYPNYLFVITNDGGYDLRDNVLKASTMYTTDYSVANDLIEISYISNFCDVIIGRSSGPFSCCLTADNILSPNKKILNVVKCLWEGTFGFPDKIKTISSDNTEDQLILEIRKFL